MKAFILIVFIILLSFSRITAQEKAILGKYIITVQPLQLFVQDIPMCIERTFKRNTLGVILGYRFKTHWDENTAMPYYNFNYQIGPEPFIISGYQAFTFGVNAKHYTRNGYYFEGQLFYRYWWENGLERYVQPNFQKETYNVYTNIVGFKCLFGHTSSFLERGKFRFILNKYCGLSLRGKDIGDSRFYDSPSVQKSAIQIGFQLGISLGITTFPKNITLE